MTDDFILYDPNFHEKMKISQSPYLLTINSATGSMLVQIGYDGSITFGPDYKPEEATEIFWNEIGAAPVKRIKELEALILDVHKDLCRQSDYDDKIGFDKLDVEVSKIKARAALGEKE